MNERYFKRVQIAGLFIISFLGTLVHMAMHFLSTDNSLFTWAGNLLQGLKAEGATLSSVAGAAELPAHEAMSAGMLYIMIIWFALMIVPAIIALLTDKKAWRWVTAIVGTVMVLGGIADGIGHTFQPGQLALGLGGLIIGSIPGIIAVVLAFGWARAKE